MKYLILFLIISSSLSAQPMPTAEMAEKAGEIAKAYQGMGWFSGAVLIAEKGKPIFQKAYGLADIKNNIPNTLQTKFRIGSINKDYTAVLILQQVQRGNIFLEDKLSKFDLGFPKNIADKISVRQLLSHTSGFGDIFIPEYLDNIRSYKNIGDILPLLMNEPLMFEPGTEEEYSNYNYIVLGAILEKTTGKTFGQLLNENIHANTGCKNTEYDIAENLQGTAKSYRYSITGNKKDHTPLLEYPTPDGGMYATADDVLAFFQTLFFSEKLLKDEYKTLMVTGFRPTDKSWQDILAQPQAGIGLAGGGPGVSAAVEANLHENYFIIILANTDQQVAEEMAGRMWLAKTGREYPAAILPSNNFLYNIYKKHGKTFLVNNFKKELMNAGYEDIHPGLLNSSGYALMQENKLAEAIDIFRANIELFPEEANPYDSLAEAYLEKGDKTNALKYYKMALDIDPELPSAKRAVEELK
ncbi:MAG TPA: serine hydrolase [Bacteroidetes bacterium]|nr:serine hydrolase [Bacteroidota bacterium]